MRDDENIDYLTPDSLREKLFELQDIGYRDFHLRTCPQAQHVIGVRVPEQRKLAKQILKGNFWQFLDEIQPYYYEEILITGIVIAAAPLSTSERLGYVSWFLPQINNWAICDTFCASFRITDCDLPQIWNYLESLASDPREYVQRFRLVMMLGHFLLPEYLPQIFQIIDQLKSDKYYINMAIAWLVAEAFARYRDETLDYLQRDQLTPEVHNKAIQKTRESRRVTAEDKDLLNSMKL